MDINIASVIGAVAFLVLGPFVGMLVTGIDRKLTARIQGRVGPPILQPFYDVRKLLAKERTVISSYISFYVLMALLMAIVAGVIFFAGLNLLFSIFMLTLSSLFVVLAAYSAASPYSDAGAQRENLQIMAYEPLMMLMPLTIYLICGVLDVSSLLSLDLPLIATMPLVFLAFLFILTIKLRKSPFDIASSHHGHQEIVKGITTEMSGRTLAMIEIMDWYEIVLLMGMVGMFGLFSQWWGWLLAVLLIVLAFFLEILLDNNEARLKWKAMLVSSWIVTFVLVAVELAVYAFVA